MSSECIWDACEKRVEGKQNIIDYWTEYHAAFKETLGKPERVLFGDHMVYLQVKIRLEFLQEGAFFGKTCKEGEALDFIGADFYELDDEGKIVSGYVYITFFNS